MNEVLIYNSCHLRQSTQNYWEGVVQSSASALITPWTNSLTVYICFYKSWMCVDVSCKTVYMSSQWEEIIVFLKCCWFLFDETEALDYFCGANKTMLRWSWCKDGGLRPWRFAGVTGRDLPDDCEGISIGYDGGSIDRVRVVGSACGDATVASVSQTQADHQPQGF